MAVVAFIEPPQVDVIEKILRGHQSGAMVGGLWRSSRIGSPSEVPIWLPLARPKSEVLMGESTELGESGMIDLGERGAVRPTVESRG